ncbi:MAG: leucyl/phenylalanyl-tRNA--protein transferase [Deltaproteobacteria bacterium]|nr:leucyl/phenylalanyl-tRNA--protein transferase [Deltaproteobacteria bacterium]
MPLFRLSREPIFPPPELATKSGLLALGGDLSSERLLLAYRTGIFPWYAEGEPILWWSPDPRFVLFPEHLKVSKTMKPLLRRNDFTVTYDRSFREVVEACREPRRHQGGTWITDEMARAYCRLHEQGFAHSVEAWRDGELAGGLYGVSLGGCFFGESMFTRVSNASKAAFITQTTKLAQLGFVLVDCQVFTPHLRSLGAEMIPRSHFLSLLRSALEKPTLQGNWGEMEAFRDPAGAGSKPRA